MSCFFTNVGFFKSKSTVKKQKQTSKILKKKTFCVISLTDFVKLLQQHLIIYYV